MDQSKMPPLESSIMSKGVAASIWMMYSIMAIYTSTFTSRGAATPISMGSSMILNGADASILMESSIISEGAAASISMIYSLIFKRAAAPILMESSLDLKERPPLYQ